MITPLKLYAAGYRDLISVIPPGASLAPGSKIIPSSVGKVPGRKIAGGRWAGFGWRKHETTAEDIERWESDGANFGLRADCFPALDIDSLNEGIAKRVEELALRMLGPAPSRVGKPPKRLLMYRTDEPFSRMRITLEDANQTTHLIELLAEGQQYLVFGTHPATLRPYEWSVPELPTAADLTPITREMVASLFATIANEFQALGFNVRREGDGHRRERLAVADQTSLHAPSIEKLAKVVALIPNTDEHFGSRDDYIKVGAAIRAACGDAVEDGFEVFLDWCSRWVTETGKTNEPHAVRADWERLYPPFSVGWPWLVYLARGYGYNDAADEFPAEGTAPVRERSKFSDQWLAAKVIERLAERLRYVPARKRWLRWNGHGWLRCEPRPRPSVCVPGASARASLGFPSGARSSLVAERPSAAHSRTGARSARRQTCPSRFCARGPAPSPYAPRASLAAATSARAGRSACAWRASRTGPRTRARQDPAVLGADS